MKEMCRLAVLVLGFAALAAAVSSAAPISYNATLDTVVYQFHSDAAVGPCPGGMCLATSRVSLESSAGLPLFSANFAIDKQLGVTLAAPAGYRFVFTPPADATSVSFIMQFSDILSSFGWRNDWAEDGVSLEFGGTEGATPSTTGFLFTPACAGVVSDGCSNDHFTGYFSGRLSGPLSFTSITANFNVPAGYNLAFEQLSPGVYLGATAFWSWSTLPPNAGVGPQDPGVWLTIEPAEAPAVPEPASLLLLGTGLVGCARAWKSRRR